MPDVYQIWIFALAIIISIWIIALGGITIHMTQGSSTNYDEHANAFAWVSTVAGMAVIIAVAVLYTRK